MDTLPELKDQSCFVKHCEVHGGLCVVVITPTYGSDKKQDLKYVDLVKQVEEAREDSFFHFSWANGLTLSFFFFSFFLLHPRILVSLVISSS